MPGSMTIVLPSRNGALLAAALDAIASALSAADGPDVRSHVDVVVVVGSGNAAAVGRAPHDDLDVLVVDATPDLGAMRNAGIDRARGELVWLLDDRGVVTRAALEAHLGHDRAEAALLMGPCPVPAGNGDAVDAAWWYTDRDLRLAEREAVHDPRDAAFANTSAPTLLLRSCRFPVGYHGVGIEDLEVGMLLADGGHVTAFDRAAAIGAIATAPGDELARRRLDGVDRARFVARHPDRRDVVLSSTPGRLERALRHLAAAPVPAVPRALGVGARLLDRASSVPLLDRVHHQLHELGLTCARYGGVAAGAAADPVVRAALRESAAAATVPYGRAGRWMREQVLDRARAVQVPLRVRHVHGPRTVAHGVDELAAVTIVRDGRFYVANFLAHHRRLGVRHFVVLDNGSTDGTLELLCAQPDVTVLRTSAPYKHSENLLKRYLVRRFSSGRW
ncbi:MAG TPA: glycosyltransferase family 2 protein, partial [Ilumatobacteraceae bacterium]|nr:glycosyltransferase family 2 protein [Ilumatobacteraceae bacterium]